MKRWMWPWAGPGFDFALQGMRLTMDMQHVVAMRLAKLAQGGPAAGQEAFRMVQEKTDALIQAQGIMARAVGAGRTDGGAAAVMRLYRRRVRANRQRLGGAP